MVSLQACTFFITAEMKITFIIQHALFQKHFKHTTGKTMPLLMSWTTFETASLILLDPISTH